MGMVGVDLKFEFWRNVTPMARVTLGTHWLNLAEGLRLVGWSVMAEIWGPRATTWGLPHAPQSWGTSSSVGLRGQEGKGHLAGKVTTSWNQKAVEQSVGWERLEARVGRVPMWIKDRVAGQGGPCLPEKRRPPFF